MRFLAPSKEDIRTWGRCLSAYPGATATGSTEKNLQPLLDGGLSAAIPLSDPGHAQRLCDAIGLEPMGPKSDTRDIEEAPLFKLGLTGYKFETSFRGAIKWFTNCNLLLLEDARVFSLVSSETYLGSSITSSIEEVGLLVDKVIAADSSVVPVRQVFESAGVTI